MIGDDTGVATPMPQYKSHKTVWALKIKDIKPYGFEENCEHDGSYVIFPEDNRYAPFRVSGEYCDKHKPKAGGYFVQYKDGYQSWSPAQAFEEGYERV